MIEFRRRVKMKIIQNKEQIKELCDVSRVKPLFAFGSISLQKQIGLLFVSEEIIRAIVIRNVPFLKEEGVDLIQDHREFCSRNNKQTNEWHTIC